MDLVESKCAKKRRIARDGRDIMEDEKPKEDVEKEEPAETSDTEEKEEAGTETEDVETKE